MPTYWTQTLIPTLREAPAEAVVPSHQLLLRAGFISKLGSGLYTYLPLGLRSLHRAIAIVRDEMNKAGAAELLMPMLQPIKLWEDSGRREKYGDNLMVLTDRHDNENALAPTHEEVVTSIVAEHIQSYKDLPKNLYQIQTKFRDEFRPRFGVLRTREFTMKDAYSFHLTQEGEAGLDVEYQNMHDTYCRIFDRCGLPYRVVFADAGEIGGDGSQEFMVPAPTGEDTILASDKIDETTGRPNYAANVEKAATGPRPSNLHGEPKGDLEIVDTPGAGGIDDVCEFFKKQLKSKLKPQNMLKTLVCKGQNADGSSQWVLAVVRGDHELNEAKLKEAWRFDIALADEQEARDAGFVIGYVGPHVAVGRNDITLMVDPDAAQPGFWVTGANEKDKHVKSFNWMRELGEEDKRRWDEVQQRAILTGDIRNAEDGDPSPLNDGGTLHATKGIELGHIFKLGDNYSSKLGANVLDENNQTVDLTMGCYGIGVNRILAAAIELEDGDRKGHDDQGILWPKAIAPYDILITTIQYTPDNQVGQATTELAALLEEAGLDVLIDNRDERPGVKFKDADLIGIPLRVTIGDKGLSNNQIEIKARNGSNGPKGEAIDFSDPMSAAEKIVALFKTLP